MKSAASLTAASTLGAGVEDPAAVRREGLIGVDGRVVGRGQHESLRHGGDVPDVQPPRALDRQLAVTTERGEARHLVRVARDRSRERVASQIDDGHALVERDRQPVIVGAERERSVASADVFEIRDHLTASHVPDEHTVVAEGRHERPRPIEGDRAHEVGVAALRDGDRPRGRDLQPRRVRCGRRWVLDVAHGIGRRHPASCQPGEDPPAHRRYQRFLRARNARPRGEIS
jgi:hypothetical protein